MKRQITSRLIAGAGVALLAYPLYLGALFAPVRGEFGGYGPLFGSAFGLLGMLCVLVAVDAAYRERALDLRRGATLGLGAVGLYIVYGTLVDPIVRAINPPYFEGIVVFWHTGAIFILFLLAGLFVLGITVTRHEWWATGATILGLLAILGAGTVVSGMSFVALTLALLVVDTLLGVPFLGVIVVAAFPFLGHLTATTEHSVSVANR